MRQFTSFNFFKYKLCKLCYLYNFCFGDTSTIVLLLYQKQNKVYVCSYVCITTINKGNFTSIFLMTRSPSTTLPATINAEVEEIKSSKI